MKRIVVTGAGGFIGRNLLLWLERHPEHVAVPVMRNTDLDAVFAEAPVDAIVHLAGVNRVADTAEFAGNPDYLGQVIAAARAHGAAPLLVYASSTQVSEDNPYGASKRAAEAAVAEAAEAGWPAVILRMPNIYGKFARPFYNSAVATFCHQIANGQSPTIHDPAAVVRLYYVDDLVADILGILRTPPAPGTLKLVDDLPADRITVGELAATLQRLGDGFRRSISEASRSPFVEKLRSTLAAYLSPNFSVSLTVHEDSRGQFFEVMRTDAGQFSVLTSKPGVVRGMHFHHSKFESFLVLQGTAEFTTWLLDKSAVSQTVTAADRRIVMTQPGLVHSIRNVGPEELIVWVWANENFDPERPDTFAAREPSE